MKISQENTAHLTSVEFIEKLAVDLWNISNIYLIDEIKKDSIPDFFYITAYIIQFDTELQMEGLSTLLTNSATFNFENTLNSFRKIGCINAVNCLEGILNTLDKYGMTPVKMREKFLQISEGYSENSIIQLFIEENLLEDLANHQNELVEIQTEIWEDLEMYLVKVRGK